MPTRMTSETVTFTQPFQIEENAAFLPPGAYVVDTEEELVDDISFPVWRRIATVMCIIRAGATEHVAIDPEVLRAALAYDGTGRPPGPLGF